MATPADKPREILTNSSPSQSSGPCSTIRNIATTQRISPSVELPTRHILKALGLTSAFCARSPFVRQSNGYWSASEQSSVRSFPDLISFQQTAERQESCKSGRRGIGHVVGICSALQCTVRETAAEVWRA